MGRKVQPEKLIKPKRVNIKKILKNPKQKKLLLDGAVDFICKIENINPHDRHNIK